MSKIALNSGRRKVLSSDVDHTVPYALWKRRVEKELQGNDENEMKELIDLANKLGNCILLEKTFNISKSDNQLADFIPKIHEFEQGLDPQAWAAELLLAKEMMNASSASLHEIRKAIETRDSVVKAELKQFVRGEKARIDTEMV